MMKKPLLYTHVNWPGFSSWYQRSRFMDWDVRKCNHGDPHEPPPPDSVVFYTNSELEHAAKHVARRKIALLLETKYIAWWTYAYAEAHLDDFDTVLTYDDELIARHPDKCTFYPHGGCSIPPDQRQIYEKNKLVSFWATTRKTAPGHYLRHEFYEIYTQRESNWAGPYLGNIEIDCYGQLPHNYAKTMLDCLQDYMFQIVAENNISDTYFTEKLIDCLVTGTIPIYRGSRGTGRFFDPDGILYFTTMEELLGILQNLTPQTYFDRLDAVRANFAAAEDFVLAEDWIYKNTNLFDLDARQDPRWRPPVVDGMSERDRARPRSAAARGPKQKIFGIGLYKTGTRSLGQALEHFGDRVDFRFWMQLDNLTAYFNMDSGQFSPFEHEIRARAEHYDAFGDAPWLYLYRELDNWFPTSKFILTLRKSAAAVADSEFRMWKRTGLWEQWRVETGHEPTHEMFVKRYEQHNRNVLEYFAGRSSDLLTICWETEPEPWQRLADFLESDSVPRAPFPHANRDPDSF